MRALQVRLLLSVLLIMSLRSRMQSLLFDLATSNFHFRFSDQVMLMFAGTQTNDRVLYLVLSF